jgi:hypothetical protein
MKKFTVRIDVDYSKDDLKSVRKKYEEMAPKLLIEAIKKIENR